MLFPMCLCPLLCQGLVGLWCRLMASRCMLNFFDNERCAGTIGPVHTISYDDGVYDENLSKAKWVCPSPGAFVAKPVSRGCVRLCRSPSCLQLACSRAAVCFRLRFVLMLDTSQAPKSHPPSGKNFVAQLHHHPASLTGD